MLQNAGRRDETGVPMKKANLDLIAARYEAVNAHDVDRFKSFYSDSILWRDPGTARAAKGPSAVGRRLEAWIAAVPNLKWTLDELFGEGDRLCAQFTFTGTHKGVVADSRGNQLVPTDQRLRIPAVGVYVVDGRKIVDSHIYFDLAPFRGASRTESSSS
jgi:predicted ester cyclase